MGFTSLARPSTGISCLTVDPALGTDPLIVAAEANVEFGNTAAANIGYAWVRAGATQPGSCQVEDFAVHTFVLAGDALVTSNLAAFTIIVP